MTNTQAKNYDPKTVEGFADEWSRFDQSKLSEKELLDPKIDIDPARRAKTLMV